MLSFGLPFLLLWLIILPGILFKGLKSNRNQLQNVFVMFKWGYFYNEYKLTAYYWEFVKIFEKTLITIILTYYQDKVIVKGIICFIIVYAYSEYQLANKPYSNKELNQVDRSSTNVCATSIIIGVFIYEVQNVDNIQYFVYAGYIILLIINAQFLIWMVWKLMDGYRYSLRETIDGIVDKVNDKYPHLKQNYPKLKSMLTNQGKASLNG